METLHINDVREMSRVRIINALAHYVPDNQYKRIDFLKMETDVLRDLLACYLDPRKKMPEKSKTVIMRLAEPQVIAPRQRKAFDMPAKKVAVKKAAKKK